ncbi:MAG: pseudouridine synthase [Polyangiaceae bacterium]|nr:pseudouridine synthase [Polyangiaceae bacterium]
MAELLNTGWPERRVLSDENGLLVVDKPAGIPVHGGDEGLKDDVVSRLAGWFRAHGESEYLGVHQRLDKETSGVLVFTRSEHRNRDVAEAFESHTVQKKYVALASLAGVKAGQLKRLEGTWEDRLSKPEKGRVSVARTGGLEAVTRCRVLEQCGQRVLMELSPVTGRTHQLRVQASARGIPIVGDSIYGGEPALRLMLHAHELKLPKQKAWVAPIPGVFRDWLYQRPFDFETEELKGRLLDSFFQREPLSAESNTYRLVNDLGDQLPGVCIDKFGDSAVVSLFDERASAAGEKLSGLLLDMGFSRVRVEHRERAVTKVLSAPAVFTVQEHGANFEVRFDDDSSVGLFLDQRENRQRLRALSKGLRVLNLFCYTGSFSVAAALGGARQVVSVDLSGRYLEWAKRNFELNGLTVDRHEFIQADATVWLEQAARQKRVFDFIVLDPPSFSSVGKRKTFSVARDYAETASQCLRLLAPGGQLLAVTNHRKTPLPKLRSELRKAAASAGRTVLQLKDIRSGRDCPDLLNEPHPSKSVLVRVK